MHSKDVNHSRSKVKANPRLCECGDHVWDVATKGFVVLVSPEDAGKLSKKWSAKHAGRGKFYAHMRGVGLLHRTLLKLEPGEFGDHENSNGMDCRRRNIRRASHVQNQMNRRVRVDNASGFKGVWQSHSGRYCARIKVEGKPIHLGSFDTATQAHSAYCEAARAAFGRFFNAG